MNKYFELNRQRLSLKIILFCIPLAAFLFSFTVGRYGIELPQLISTFYLHYFGSSLEGSTLDTVVFNIRLPRIIAGMLIGGALSCAGAAYQGMFKNPLVSPDILGASAGACFGACLAIYFSYSVYMIQLWAFCFGLLAVLLACFINNHLDYDPTLGLVLGGILISTLFSSGTAAIKTIADGNDKLPEITFWLMGSLSSVNQRDVLSIIIPMLIGFAALVMVRWRLNVLAFGEDEARTLGVNTRRLRILVIMGATLITAASVSICGMVGWIGLVVPHLARAIVGPNYRILLPVSFILGASYLLLVDDLARSLGSVEVPLGILTALLGVPFFIIIFKYNVRGWK
ncbi:MAG: iron ABC transporter permease [Syntrophomonadaceae bacterium]|nr:iron ABC transporter permease [Syntrophomonadaceae bacterium]MDD3022727.1 iron ABC transporter permease [Syntrophomonadaceae bacterium]